MIARLLLLQGLSWLSSAMCTCLYVGADFFIFVVLLMVALWLGLLWKYSSKSTFMSFLVAFANTTNSCGSVFDF